MINLIKHCKNYLQTALKLKKRFFEYLFNINKTYTKKLKKKLNTNKKENTEYFSGIDGILEGAPSNYIVVIPIIIIIFVFSVLLWLTLSKVDIIAPSVGKIIPNSKMQFIQPKSVSTISNIYVQNGDIVQKGDLLVSFKKNIEAYEVNILEKKYESLYLQKISLEYFINYINNNNSTKNIDNIDNIAINASLSAIKIYNNDLDSKRLFFDSQKSLLTTKVMKLVQERVVMQNNIKKIEGLIPFSEEKIKSLSVLVEDGLEAKDKLNDIQKELMSAKFDLDIKKSELKGIILDEQIAKGDLKQFVKNTLQESFKELKSTNNELQTISIEYQKSKYQLKALDIKSPIKGIVYNLGDNTKQKVVQSGDVIMQIIPTNSPLEVEANVLNKDIGFVHKNQKVKIKIDSFKFTKYGHIEGVITNIEQASNLDEDLGEVYPITVRLKKATMNIDGKTISLMPGMTCIVDIKIGKRRLIDYIISPMIRYKDEALRER